MNKGSLTNPIIVVTDLGNQPILWIDRGIIDRSMIDRGMIDRGMINWGHRD